MNAKTWNNLKSRRDLEHRTRRQAHRAQQLRRQRHIPLAQRLTEKRVIPVPYQFEDVTPKKPGFFQRAVKFISRRAGV